MELKLASFYRIPGGLCGDGSGARLCNKCLDAKDDASFGSVRNTCKACVNARQNELAAGSPGRKSAYDRAHAERHPAKYLLRHAKERAALKGIPFALCVDDIFIPEHCPVFGIPLQMGRKGRSDSAPTLDRIDNSKGYVRGNVAVISWKANRTKSDASASELERIAAWMRSQGAT